MEKKTKSQIQKEKKELIEELWRIRREEEFTSLEDFKKELSVN